MCLLFFALLSELVRCQAQAQATSTNRNMSTWPVLLLSDKTDCHHQSKPLLQFRQALAQRGLKTDKGCSGQAENLQALRILGNEALHDLETPGELELRTALDLVEHLLRTIYETRERADHLRRLRDERRTNST